jgi:hypothetical protein
MSVAHTAGIRRRHLPPILVVLLSLVVAALAACAPPPVTGNRRGQVDGTAFEFSTGGDTLTEDNGAWLVRVRGDAMWVAWVKDGKTKEYGTFQLNSKESNRLWDLIGDARIHKRRPGADFGMAAPVYSFTVLRPKKLSHTVTVRVRDAQNDETLGPLVDYLAKLIKKYAKKKPRLEPQ